MFIHIFLPGNEVTAEQVRSSKLASARLRMWPLIEAARLEGYEITLGDTAPPHTELAVVGKIGAANIARRQDHWLNQMRVLQSAKRRVVLDYTDHHLETSSVMTPFYSRAVHSCDTIVCPTSALSAELQQTVISPKFMTIFDLMEYPTAPPKSNLSSKNVKVMWFGHPSNGQFLAKFIDENSAGMADCQLVVVSTSDTVRILQQYPYQQRPALELSFVDWSPQNVLEISRQVDLCVIPSDLRSSKRFASNNRLVTALSLGLPTIATPIDSYKEFSKFFAEESSEIASAVMRSPLTLVNEILEFQHSHAPQFQQDAIISSWRELLRS